MLHVYNIRVFYIQQSGVEIDKNIELTLVMIIVRISVHWKN